MPSLAEPSIEDRVGTLQRQVRQLEDWIQDNKTAQLKNNQETKADALEVARRVGMLEKYAPGWEKTREVVLLGDRDFAAVALNKLSIENSRAIGRNAEQITELRRDVRDLVAMARDSNAFARRAIIAAGAGLFVASCLVVAARRLVIA